MSICGLALNLSMSKPISGGISDTGRVGRVTAAATVPAAFVAWLVLLVATGDDAAWLTGLAAGALARRRCLDGFAGLEDDAAPGLGSTSPRFYNDN